MKKVTYLTVCSLLGLLMACAQQTPTVDEVVNKMTDAMGGADKLAATTDRVETWEFTMLQMPPEMGGGAEMAKKEGEEATGMTMPMIITCKRPNKLRFDFKGPDGSVYMSSWYDGTTAHSMRMGQTVELSEAELQEWESMAATWMDGYHNYQEKGFALELLPNEKVDGQEYLVLQGTDRHGNVTKNYINPATYHLERTSGLMMNMAAEKEQMTMTLADYKAVDGIALAHYVAQYNSNGDMVWEAKLQKADLNAGVEDSIFMGEAVAEK